MTYLFFPFWKNKKREKENPKGSRSKNWTSKDVFSQEIQKMSFASRPLFLDTKAEVNAEDLQWMLGS
jgi:hypothetical protein